MDFFVYLSEDTSFMTSFHATGADDSITFEDVIQKFADLYKEKVSIQLNTEKMHIYSINNRIPFKKSCMQEIIDKTQKIITKNLNGVDLILSEEPISESPEPKAEEPTETDKQPEAVPGSLTQQQLDDLIQHGLVYLEIKDYKTAWMTFKRAQIACDSDSRPLYYLIKILIKTHRYKMALSNATTGIQLFPYDRNIHLLYAKIHAKHEQYQEAIQIYQFTLYNWKISEKETNDILLKIAKCLIALNEYNEALSLIESKKNHVGCLYKAAEIYLIQGRFLEAVTAALDAHKISLDYTKFAKFISNAITTDERAIIFRNELGDNMYLTDMLFFCGDSLFNAGEFDIAFNFYLEAFSLRKKSSTIALGALKCLLGSTTGVQTLMTFCRSFMRSFQEKIFISSVIKIIPDQLVNDFESKKVIEAKEFKPISFENEEASFRIDDIDAFGFIVLMQTILFCSGYITYAEEIYEAIAPLILPFNMNMTIGAKYAQLFTAVSSFAPTIARPLPFSKPAFVIGDKSVLPLAYRTITIHGEERQLRPILIDDLSIHSIDDSKKTPQNRSFKDTIFNLDPGAVIIFCFGALDVKRGAIQQTERMEFDTLEQAYSGPISTLCLKIRFILAHLNFTIFVHPVIPTLSSMKDQTAVFNKVLYEKIRITQKLIKNVHIIDVLPKILDENNALKSEFVFNDFFANPSYVKCVEESIKEVPPPPPEKQPLPQPLQEQLEKIEQQLIQEKIIQQQKQEEEEQILKQKQEELNSRK